MTTNNVSQKESTRNAATGRRIYNKTIDDEGLKKVEPKEPTIPVNQLWRWEFRLNAYEPFDPKPLWDNLNRFCKEFYFQLEEGDSGYMHWQGCLSLYEKERLAQVKDIIGNEQVNLQAVKNWHALKNYVQKSKTRIDGPWNKDSVWIDIITKLSTWQQEAENIMLEKPDKRTIYWLWEPIGHIGKTEFTKYCHITHKATILGNGKFSDLAYAIPDNPNIIIFDLPRTCDGKVNYTAIEKCKDGMVFSSKYKSSLKLFNPPHVFIFANFPPEENALSEDRWEIIDLSVFRKLE